MSNTLIKVYDDFSVAQAVRERLLASGFPSSRVHLSAREDEAGPVEGNFTVGNKDDDAKDIRGSDDPYTRDFANVVQRGIYMLTVDANSEDESARASDILNQQGTPQPGEKDAGR